MNRFIKSIPFAIATLGCISLLASCSIGGRNYLVIPHSVSSAAALTVDNLNLSQGDYEILNTITETASVICEYKGSQIKISGEQEPFSYIFSISKLGWTLQSFSGAASLGYFATDIDKEPGSFIPNGEEFARRVAMARIIHAAKDYQADGVVEPVVISSANNVGKNKIEYVTTVSAKLISIKTTK